MGRDFSEEGPKGGSGQRFLDLSSGPPCHCRTLTRFLRGCEEPETRSCGMSLMASRSPYAVIRRSGILRKGGKDKERGRFPGSFDATG